MTDRWDGLESAGLDLFDLMQESVIVVGPDGRVSAWNRAAELLYGRPRRSAVGRAYEDIFGNGSWQAAAASPGGLDSVPVVSEVRRVSASGRQLIVAVRRFPQSFSPEKRGWVELGTDLTSLREAEGLEQANRRQYDNLIQAIPVAVTAVDFSEARALLAVWMAETDADPKQWLTDNPDRAREMMRSTYVVETNPFTLEMFRTQQGADILRSIDAFWPERATPDYIDWIAATLAGEHHFAREIVQRTVEGEEIATWFTTRFAPGTLDQGRFIVTLIDLSEVKRTEAAIRRGEAFYTDMFHGSPFSAWRLDASQAQDIYTRLREDGDTDFRAQLERDPGLIWRLTDAIKVVDLNETSVSLFGGGSRDEMIGSAITPLWIPEALEALIGGLEATFAGNESYKSVARMRTLDGREIDVLFTLSWSGARHEAGELLLAVVDMTEKVEAENALVETQAALAHATRVSTLGELTASIAHEVKQPLAALTANGGAALRWLSRPTPDIAQCQSLIEAMIADARRASDVVTHVRSLASPQIGHVCRLSLSALVDEAMKLVAAQLQREGVSTILMLPPCLPGVIGDKVQLQQVVVNLALNASQAMAGVSTPKLMLRTEIERSNVVLTVEDTGPGIPAQDLDKLFGSFFTTKHDGMGIGLAICRTIVEAHDGTITAHNMDGGGACFKVSLPAAASQ